MNIKYMFDKHDVIKYRFLKKFMEASKSEEPTIYPMKSGCKDQERKKFLSAILGTENEDDLWKKYYEGVCKYLDVKEDVRYELKDKENLKGIIFLDPDTGIDKKNKKSEHLLIYEIKELVGSKKTIIIYQHGNRAKGGFEVNVRNKLSLLNKEADIKKEKIAAYHIGKDICFIVINSKEYPAKIGDFQKFNSQP